MRNTDRLSKLIAKEFENAGQNVRKYYQRRLPSNPAKDYYYLLRDTPNNETLIVEYGFTDSSGDDVNQIKNNWESLAEAVVKALATYIGVPYYVSGNNYYIVKKGDSLWSIAKNNNTTVDNLKKINNLSTNLLSIGQKLLLSTDNQKLTNNNYYIVVSGDTLYGIAQKLNTTVDKLKQINNLTTNFLSVGQKLIIPSNNNYYIVKAGDTLYAISRKFNTTVDKIKELNGLTSNLLTIGQQLKTS